MHNTRIVEVDTIIQYLIMKITPKNTFNFERQTQRKSTKPHGIHANFTRKEIPTNNLLHVTTAPSCCPLSQSSMCWKNTEPTQWNSWRDYISGRFLSKMWAELHSLQLCNSVSKCSLCNFSTGIKLTFTCCHNPMQRRSSSLENY